MKQCVATDIYDEAQTLRFSTYKGEFLLMTEKMPRDLIPYPIVDLFVTFAVFGKLERESSLVLTREISQQGYLAFPVVHALGYLSMLMPV